MSSTRSSAFELAVLALMADAPVHGYELRQRLATTLGSLRVFSYGSLYPMLRRLETAGLIDSTGELPDPDALPLSSKRSRVVYRITADGKERLADLLGDTGPASWTDDGFEVHLAFFSHIRPETRVRILEGRRRRLEERREKLRASLARRAERRDRIDAYTEQLQQLGLEATDREVRWLEELIATERNNSPPDD